MTGWLGAAFMLVGAAFMLVAAVGVVRMPDLFTRMQAAAKTGTAGAGCVLIGTALHFADPHVAAEAGVVVVFLLLTTPVAAHLLARAAYVTRVPLAPGTVPDELGTRFGRGSSVPGGTPPADPEAPVQRFDPLEP